MYQKWPDQVIPTVNFIFWHDDHFGLGEGGGGSGGWQPPSVYSHSNTSLSDPVGHAGRSPNAVNEASGSGLPAFGGREMSASAVLAGSCSSILGESCGLREGSHGPLMPGTQICDPAVPSPPQYNRGPHKGARLSLRGRGS